MQFTNPGPMQPGGHLPSEPAERRLGLVTLPMDNVYDRPTVYQYIVGVRWHPATRTLTWTSRALGIGLGNNDHFKVADQTKEHHSIPKLLEAMTAWSRSWTSGELRTARGLRNALGFNSPAGVLEALVEQDDRIAQLAHRDLHIAALFDASTSPVDAVRVNANGQWDGHIGATDMAIVDTIDEGADHLHKQWIEALYATIDREHVGSGDDPTVLERWTITAEHDTDLAWAVEGDLHYWTDGELRLDLDPDTVRR